MAFNAAFSFAFAWLFLRGSEVIPRQALVLDAIPQSFFVTFFGVLVPTLITRSKLSKGRLERLRSRNWRLPRIAVIRAITLGIVAAIGGGLLHLLVLYGLSIETLTLQQTLVYKPVYGAALTWLITPFAVLVALSETGGAK